MKKHQIITETEKFLVSLGVAVGCYLWQPLTAELLITVGERIRPVKLKSGITQRALLFEFGRIAGWFGDVGCAQSAQAPMIEPPSKIRKNPHAFASAARRVKHATSNKRHRK